MVDQAYLHQWYASGCPATTFTHFGLYCDRQLRVHYMGAVTAVAMISAIYFFSNEISTPKRPPCTHLHLLYLGFMAFLPAIHLIDIDEQTLYQGTILVSYNKPCRFELTGRSVLRSSDPRKIFDIYGSSHQVMHVMITCGALLCRTGLLTTLQYWRNDKVNGLVCPAA